MTNEIHSTFNSDKHFLERKGWGRKGGQNVLRNGVGLCFGKRWSGKSS